MTAMWGSFGHLIAHCGIDSGWVICPWDKSSLSPCSSQNSLTYLLTHSLIHQLYYAFDSSFIQRIVIEPESVSGTVLGARGTASTGQTIPPS